MKLGMSALLVWVWLTFSASAATAISNAMSSSGSEAAIDSAGDSTSAKNVETALWSPDTALAERLLGDIPCGARMPQTTHAIQNVWRMADSSPVSASIRDARVHTLTAKCILDASYTLRADDVEDSAVNYLRLALLNNKSEVRALAMLSIIPRANDADIATIRNIGMREEALRAMSVFALTATCLPSAIRAIDDIRARAVGYPSSKEIESLLSSPGIFDRPNTCHMRAMPAPRADADLIQREPSVQQIRQALGSEDAGDALKTMLQLQCPVSDGATRAVREAWHSRFISHSAAIRDSVILAILADCIVESGKPKVADTKDYADAVDYLRSAIRSDQVFAVLAATSGLTELSEAKDVPTIAAAVRRMPKITAYVAQKLALSCGKQSHATIQALRAETTSIEMSARIEDLYSGGQQTRQARCIELN